MIPVGRWHGTDGSAQRQVAGAGDEVALVSLRGERIGGGAGIDQPAHASGALEQLRELIPPLGADLCR